MKINEITIKNFRGFEDFYAELNPNLTVFIGNNGSGKSTVLDAISISIGTFFSGLDGVPGTGINKDDVTCKTKISVQMPFTAFFLQLLIKLGYAFLGRSTH